MVEPQQCPYCLQRLQEPGDARTIEAEDPLAVFIGVDGKTTVHEDCYLNAADRA